MTIRMKWKATHSQANVRKDMITFEDFRITWLMGNVQSSFCFVSNVPNSDCCLMFECIGIDYMSNALMFRFEIFFSLYFVKSATCNILSESHIIHPKWFEKMNPPWNHFILMDPNDRSSTSKIAVNLSVSQRKILKYTSVRFHRLKNEPPISQHLFVNLTIVHFKLPLYAITFCKMRGKKRRIAFYDNAAATHSIGSTYCQLIISSNCSITIMSTKHRE